MIQRLDPNLVSCLTSVSNKTLVNDEEKRLPFPFSSKSTLNSPSASGLKYPETTVQFLQPELDSRFPTVTFIIVYRL